MFNCKDASVIFLFLNNLRVKSLIKLLIFPFLQHQAHLSNNDQQEVGRYLLESYFRTVTVSWVEEQNAEDNMDIVINLQGRTTVLNKKSGNFREYQIKIKAEKQLFCFYLYVVCSYVLYLNV